jgi:polyisoprenoid-binding protein YceI
MMTTHRQPCLINHVTACARHAAALLVTTLYLHAGISQAAEATKSPSMPAVAPPPAGQYHVDKSHASLIVRVNHMGFSTFTTRFSRFDSDLTFDPNNLPASKVVTTVDMSSFEMDAWPQVCIDIMKGKKMLDTAEFPQMIFKSERVRMTGPKSMEITGNLTLRGVTRPIVLSATYNGGNSGVPEMDPQARIGFSAHGSFKRSDFGMNFGVPAPGTTMGVGDLVEFAIEAEFEGPPLVASGNAAH